MTLRACALFLPAEKKTPIPVFKTSNTSNTKSQSVVFLSSNLFTKFIYIAFSSNKVFLINLIARTFKCNETVTMPILCYQRNILLIKYDWLPDAIIISFY